MLEAPRITYYARVIDNITGKELLRYENAPKNSKWYYGKCDGIKGGESQYLIEFDIWNNEQAFNGGMFDVKCQDAKNCRFTVWPNEFESINDNPLFHFENSFMYARCLTNGIKEFKPVRHNDSLVVVGNVNPRIDSIKGSGDHAVVQTKIILPENCNLKDKRQNFILNFYYDCE